MEKRPHRHVRDLVAHAALRGLDANEIGCARISMMARSNTLHSKGRIQMSETNDLQISHIRLATHGRSIQMCRKRKCSPYCGCLAGYAATSRYRRFRPSQLTIDIPRSSFTLTSINHARWGEGNAVGMPLGPVGVNGSPGGTARSRVTK